MLVELQSHCAFSLDWLDQTLGLRSVLQPGILIVPSQLQSQGRIIRHTISGLCAICVEITPVGQLIIMSFPHLVEYFLA